MKCIVTGGTGFLGARIVDRLKQNGHQVAVWSRRGTNVSPDGFHAVIHLAGETVAQRWNPEVKRRIRDSRKQGTHALVDAIARASDRPRILLSTSAIGIYGDRGDEILTEASAPGRGFLADVCKEWESEAGRAQDFGLRVAKFRIGFVLGRNGGALAKMVPAFKFFAGGRLGSGKQWMPWIHIEDVVGLFIHALDNESVSGVWNATSPNPVRNADFTRELARAVHRPALIPVPPFALKLAFGELGQHMLDSARVTPQAAQAANYRFLHPELTPALNDLLG
jgi:uncharacterized protein